MVICFLISILNTLCWHRSIISIVLVSIISISTILVNLCTICVHLSTFSWNYWYKTTNGWHYWPKCNITLSIFQHSVATRYHPKKGCIISRRFTLTIWYVTQNRLRVWDSMFSYLYQRYQTWKLCKLFGSDCIKSWHMIIFLQLSAFECIWVLFECGLAMLSSNALWYSSIRAHSLYFTVDDSSDELKSGPTRKKNWPFSFFFIFSSDMS